MTVKGFVSGQLVEHPAFGLGRIIAADAATVHVYFRDRDGRFATKFPARAAGDLLRHASVQQDQWLDNLPPFVWNSNEGKYGLEAERLTQAQAVGVFKEHFPLGFQDPKYLENEREYKEKSANTWAQTLGGGEAERLLKCDDIGELSRRLLRVPSTDLLHPSWEAAPLKDGLTDTDAARVFFIALIDFVNNEPSEGRFNALVAALGALPVKQTPPDSWAVATFYPWIADPRRHAFFRPTVTLEAARRMAFAIDYRSRLNWTTYRAVLAFSRVLLDAIAPLGAKDFIDVQSFIFVTGAPDYRPSR